MFRILFALLLLIPLIEIYFLIQIGRVIGPGWTIFVVIATAIIGAALIRQQGLTTLKRAQVALSQGQVPALEMLEGLVLLISGVFLLTPGLVTDSIGFIFLITPLRQTLIKKIVSNGQFAFRGSVNGQNAYRRTEDDVIEGEVVDNDEPRLK
jgi:UPF0716 protein FxsA